jgi:hypothetical protein
MFENNIILLNIFVDCIMIIRENNWIRTNRDTMIVHDPYCDKIIMVMMFLGFVSYFPATLSS